jgi:hypothetical protein
MMFVNGSLWRASKLTLAMVTIAATMILPLTAHAELPGGAVVVFDRLFINEDGGTAKPPSTTVKQDQYFNLAHCVCSASNLGSEQAFAQEIKLTKGTTPINREGQLWVGSQCDVQANRDAATATCEKLADTIPDLEQISVFAKKATIPLKTFMVPLRTSCEEREQDSTLWVLADGDGDGTLEYSVNKAIKIDTSAPPLPTGFAASGAENAIQLNWVAPVDRLGDILYYQAFCSKIDGSAALAKPSHEPQYQTAKGLCEAPLSNDPTPTEIVAVTDGPMPPPVTTVPEGIKTLDKAFICGQTVNTATSLRIDGLENNVDYVIALAAIDKFGNAKSTYFTTALTPQPVTDFWEDLQGRGSKVEGGYCLLAQTYGDNSNLTQTLRGFRDNTLARSAVGRALTRGYYSISPRLGQWVGHSMALRIIFGTLLLPLVAMALVWHMLGFPGMMLLLAAIWLVRKRRIQKGLRRYVSSCQRSVAVTALTLFAVAASQWAVMHKAHAQSSIKPYWEDDADPETQVDAVHWRFGIRGGPYTPDIDKQFGGSVSEMSTDGSRVKGPYEAMFGSKYGIMPTLDVDRVVWQGAGQITVGGSIGYLAKKSKAYANGGSPLTPTRDRSPGDTNAFRLFPLAAVASFRLTYLDDAYGIPLVPYIRGGLAYYLWWVRAPNGNIAKACKDQVAEKCETTKAIGGSFGLQGAIGLSVRAERIDADTASSMREGGMQHAGFYAEYSVAKVDGFGSASKLAVGDATWFAGVDFEF